MANVRAAIKDDQPRLLRLWMRFMAEEPKAVPAPDVEGAAMRWKHRLASAIARRHVHVLEAGQSVQGFSMWVDSLDHRWVPAGVAYVVDMYLAPESRRGHCARALLNGMLKSAHDLGYMAVWTNTNTENHPVRILLNRCGFVEMTNFEIPGLKDQLYYRMVLA